MNFASNEERREYGVVGQPWVIVGNGIRAMSLRKVS